MFSGIRKASNVEDLHWRQAHKKVMLHIFHMMLKSAAFWPFVYWWILFCSILFSNFRTYRFISPTFLNSPRLRVSTCFIFRLLYSAVHIWITMASSRVSESGAGVTVDHHFRSANKFCNMGDIFVQGVSLQWVSPVIRYQTLCTWCSLFWHGFWWIGREVTALWRSVQFYAVIVWGCC